MRLLLQDLQPSSNYAIQVRAVSNTNGTSSDWSPRFVFSTIRDTINPDIPQSVTWVAIGNAFHGEWLPVTTNEAGEDIQVVRYEVEMTAGSVVRYASVPQSTTTKVTYDLSFENNSAYWGTPQGSISIRVRAVDGKELKSAWSASISATNPPPAPVASGTATGGTGQIALTWAKNTEDDIAGYNVYVGTTSGFTPDKTPTGNRIFSGDTNTFNFQTSNYALQYFKIRAFDTFGSESTLPDLTLSATALSPFVVDTTPPGVPSISAATLATNVTGTASELSVTWSLASPPTDLQGFQIRYLKNSASTWSQVSASKDDTSIVIPGLAPYVSYSVQIRSVDFMGNYSSWSSTTVASAPSNSVPPDVAGLTSVAGRDSIQYSWTESTADDVKNGAGLYEVTFSTSPTFASGNITYKTGAPTLTVSGLAPSTTYYARVKAIDSAGQYSANWSSTDTKATTAFPLTPLSDGSAPASSPTPVIASGIGNLNVSWTPVANADLVTYEVHISTTSGFTPGAGTKVAENMGTVVVLEKDAAGTNLAYGTTYYVKLIAKDRDGAATASAQASGSISKALAGDITLTPTDIGAATPTDVTNAQNAAATDATTKANAAQAAAIAAAATDATTKANAAAAVGTNRDKIYTPDSTNGTSKWLRMTYNQTNATGTIPTYNMIRGLIPNTSVLVSDGATLASALGDNYVGHLRTLMTVASQTTVTSTLTHDDTCQIFVDGVSVYSKNAFTAAANVSFTLSPGTHLVDILWMENSGGDGITVVTPTFGSQVTSLVAPVSADVEPLLTIAAQSTAASAQTTANGKNKVTYAGGTPGTTANTAGDIWFQVTAGVIVGQWEGQGGTSWAARTLDNAVIANLDAGKLTAGTIAAARIGAGTIDATKLNVTVGGGNLFADSSFETLLTTGWSAGGQNNSSIVNSPAQAYRGGRSILVTSTAAGAFAAVNSSSAGNAVSGRKYVVSAWVYVPAGMPDIVLQTFGSLPVVNSATMSTKGAWTRVIVATTANANTAIGLGIVATATAGGQTFYIDGVQVEEGEIATAYSPKADEILPGTINAAMMQADSITASNGAIANLAVTSAKINDVSASKLTAGTVSAQIIKIANTGSVESTDYAAGSAGFKLSTGGLEIRNGIIAANTIVSGTGIINNLVINSGGAIQSSVFDATHGFKIDSTGIQMNDSGSSVKADAIKAGTLGGVGGSGIINVAAGTSLNLNGGYLKSNSYTGTSQATNPSGTGFYLGDDGLRIDTGKINAAALTSGSVSTATLTLTGTGTITGPGYTLNGTGLTVTTGTISAAALQLQQGENIMPVAYADFEFIPSFYSSLLLTSGTAVTDVTDKAINKQSLKWSPSAASGTLTLGTNATDYNITVKQDVATTDYIISYYAMIKTGATALSIQPTLKYATATSPGTLAGTNQAIPANSTWARYSTVVTLPANTPIGTALLYFTASAAGVVYIDGIQVEEKWTSKTGPSAWTAPSMTTIDGGMIKTGSIQSTATSRVWNSVKPGTEIYASDGTTIVGYTGGWDTSSQPAWSISTAGDASFGDLKVKANLVVGQAGEVAGALSTISSYNYVPSAAGFLLRSDGFVEFNQVVTNSLHGSAITTDTLDAKAIKSGLVDADLVLSGSIKTSVAGQRLEMDTAGIRWYDADDVSDNPSIVLPTDPQQTARFTGNVSAQQISVSNMLSIEKIDPLRADANPDSARLEPGAGLRLAIGITAPTYAPTPDVSWPAQNNYGVQPSNANLAYSWGLHVAANGYRFLCYRGGSYTTGAGWNGRVLRTDSNGNAAGLYNPSYVGAGMGGTIDRVNYMVVDMCDDDAGTGYWLLWRSNDGNDAWVTHHDANLAQYSGSTHVFYVGGSTGGGIPGMGTQSCFTPTGVSSSAGVLYIAGGYMGVATNNGNRVVSMLKVTISTGGYAFRQSTYQVAGTNWNRGDTSQNYIYSGDLRHGCRWTAEGLYVPITVGGSNGIVRCFAVIDASTIALATAYDFYAAENKQILGMAHNGTSFFTNANYDVTGGVYSLRSYSNIANVGAATATWWTSHEWRRVTPDYRTGQGAQASFTMYQRAYLGLKTGSIPYSTDAAAPDYLSMFIGSGASKPGAAAMYRVYSGTATSVNITSVTFSGSNANDTHTVFPNGENARIFSTGVDGSSNPLIELKSDGSGRMGPYAWNNLGVMTAQPQPTGAAGGDLAGSYPSPSISGARIQRGSTGTGSVTSNASGTYSFGISWGGMYGAPSVVATVGGTSALFCSVSSVTTTGCTMTLQHRGATSWSGSYTVHWIAMC